MKEKILATYASRTGTTKRSEGGTEGRDPGSTFSIISGLSCNLHFAFFLLSFILYL